MRALLFLIGGIALTLIFVCGLSGLYLYIASPLVRKSVTTTINNWMK